LDRLSDYDYSLPEDLIAQTPLEDRSASRLLWLHRDGSIEHRQFREVPDLLAEGDVLVMNDTRVSAVRLIGKKSTGAVVEALLLRRIAGLRYEALVKPGKRLKQGTRIQFPDQISAIVVEDRADGMKVLEFEDIGDLGSRIESVGLVPLPPYIHSSLSDKERYQTVYGVSSGSAAAPTAGLHFTPSMLTELEAKRVQIAKVTLHVGLDTFRPVQAEDLNDHRMHGEACEVSAEAAELINNASGRIIAVGTTTVRTLESFAVGPRTVTTGCQVSKLFIRQGFKFKVVDGMFTNFHLPRTTMLVMISTMAGRDAVLEAYAEAVTSGYRFLSFGDSMLIV